ncbi:bifunctional folylpolyglutamate synthase/dihydrofolate synthase [Spirochaeta thermophila]|uniref:Dihydrofolate synthase/folylpolyglutamate synthase n=1 Tax=Winmispira thermophila (strain ATCC 49972 / DSM 6192 / RI 19.B1) TaxID=665571 RepID=E0RPB8_WINT6|nr:cyanophycin synthetase [Spirochaeta thermophila]ADN01312.1 folylpolyglutamate synthase [Spirochaeta thermophila DSM 6192]
MQLRLRTELLPAPIHPEVEEAFRYLERFANFERRPGEVRAFRLERVRTLCGLFGHPEEGLAFAHVAGSKGKGSTCLFLARVLEESGFRTGLYTSPHLVSYTERISRAGRPWPPEVYLDALAFLRGRLEGTAEGRALLDEVTTFELLTVLGFLVFREMGCEWVVLETGMGGRLDATNVVRPRVTVITHLELEHTEHLGETLEKIAFEKAGIIKPGVPVVVAPQEAGAWGVIEGRAREVGAGVVRVERGLGASAGGVGGEVRGAQAGGGAGGSPSEVVRWEGVVRREGVGVCVEWEDGLVARSVLSTPLLVQAENAALAAAAWRVCVPEGKVGALEQGLAGAVLPGRLQPVAEGPELWVDGSHTRDSVRAVVEALGRRYGWGEVVGVFGCVAGKDARGMLGELGRLCREVVVTRAGRFRESRPEEVGRVAEGVVRAVVVPEEEAALGEALRRAEGRRPILVTGSFYLAGEILTILSRWAAS